MENNEAITIPAEAQEQLDEYLPVQPELTPPTKREFKPWHKPRKQYIRRKQWCREIQKLIRANHFPPDNQVLRYLTLPSEDMLDIRVIEEILQEKSMKLKYLGFCNVSRGSADDTRMSISEAEVKGLPSVDDTSLVVRDMLEATGTTTSHAFTELDNHAPYHVINIDLCSHFAAPRRGGANSCIDAIRSISNVQVKKSRGSWLLFLTTRIKQDHMDSKHLLAFILAIKANVESSPEFKAKLGEAFQEVGDELIVKLEQLITNAGPIAEAGLDHVAFRRFFCIGFGKWLLSFLTTAEPKVHVEMLKSYYYAIAEEGGRDMLSLAFRCTPQVQLPVDKFGLVGHADEQHKQHEAEVKLALEMIKTTEDLVDLDLLLAQDPGEYQSITEDAKRFLEQANYDVSKYPDFENKETAINLADLAA